MVNGDQQGRGPEATALLRAANQSGELAEMFALAFADETVREHSLFELMALMRRVRGRK